MGSLTVTRVMFAPMVVVFAIGVSITAAVLDMMSVEVSLMTVPRASIPGYYIHDHIVESQ